MLHVQAVLSTAGFTVTFDNINDLRANSEYAISVTTKNFIGTISSPPTQFLLKTADEYTPLVKLLISNVYPFVFSNDIRVIYRVRAVSCSTTEVKDITNEMNVLFTATPWDTADVLFSEAKTV